MGRRHPVIDPVHELHLLEREHLADQKIGVLVDEDPFGDSEGKELAGDRSALVPQVRSGAGGRKTGRPAEARSRQHMRRKSGRSRKYCAPRRRTARCLVRVSSCAALAARMQSMNSRIRLLWIPRRASLFRRLRRRACPGRSRPPPRSRSCGTRRRPSLRRPARRPR